MITWRKRRQNRVWLHSIDDYPTDWPHMKMILEEVMAVVYYEHDRRTRAMITLERHLGGKSFTGTSGYGGYAPHPIPFKREYEAILDVVYAPTRPFLRQITVKSAQFGPALGYLREDYWWMEKGIRWRVPPLIPREHRNPDDWRTFILEPASPSYASYRATPRPNYDVRDAYPLRYAREYKGIYGRSRSLTYSRE